MSTTINLPKYAKATLLLIGLYLLADVLVIMKPILLPILYATLISILISPAVHFMVRRKVHRTLSVAIVLLTFLLAMTGIIVLLSAQASRLRASWPQLFERIKELFNQVIIGASGYLNITEEEIMLWIENGKMELLSNSGGAIGVTLLTVGSLFVLSTLTFVYTFMILNYEPHLVSFIHRLFGILRNQKVTEMLDKIKTIIRRYVVGLFAEVAIVATLNSIGLLIIGLEYAILLGTMGAFLNIIPYFGGLLAVSIFMIIALVTKPAVYVLYVLGMYLLIQFIDNNFLVPKIVGGNVKLNPFSSILVVILGAALWGIHGMFLSIPVAAIVKLIFDQVDSLKPWGFLMGDTTAPARPVQEVADK